jgi:hypothetical protein
MPYEPKFKADFKHEFGDEATQAGKTDYTDTRPVIGQNLTEAQDAAASKASALSNVHRTVTASNVRQK